MQDIERPRIFLEIAMEPRDRIFRLACVAYVRDYKISNVKAKNTTV
jgi:hypothetical protein